MDGRDRLPGPRRPAGAAVRLALAAALGTSLAGGAAAETPTELDRLRAVALDEVNRSRQEHGLGALEPSGSLDRAAQAHAADMLAGDYFAHVSPAGETVRDRYLAAGGNPSHLVLENIGTCSGCPVPPSTDRIEQFQSGWMESPGHRENILSAGVGRFGFGLAFDPRGEVVAVQTFAGPGAPEEGEAPAPLAEAQRTESLAAEVNRLRERNGVAPVEPSDALAVAAGDLLRRSADGRSALSSDRLFEAVPAEARGRFRRLAVLSADCGGCGARITTADPERFVGQWSGDPGLVEAMTSPGMTHIGAAFEADGEGGKRAIAVLGRRD